MAKSQTFTAGCSAVGSFSYAGNFTLYVVLTDRDGSSSTNVSQVDYNVYSQSNGSGSISAKHYKYFSINGSEKINTTESVNVSSPYAYISIASGTISVTHDSDGSKTIPFSAQIKASSYGVSATVSGNFELEKIPRYTTVWQSERWRTINTISVNWSTADARDHTQYSLNGGAWTDAGDTVDSTNKNGYYTISNLSPNTSYTIKTRCKRADSQLWSESSSMTLKTQDIAKITEAPNFTDEGNPTIKYSNPFGSNVTKLQACISLNGAKDDVTYRDISKTGTSYTFNLTDAERKVLRQAAKTNSLSVTFFVRTTYGKDYHSTVVRTMSIVNANPTFSNFTYQDTDSTTLALTGNNQTIIKGYSNVKGIVSAANKASPQKEASMSKYRLSIGEKTAEVAYSSSAEVSTSISDVTTNSFTMYAIDSRGNSTAKTITAANYINYAPIKITSITVLRTNSVTSETTLKFSGTVWNGSFGSVTNVITSCSYRYKLSTASSWPTGAITITPTKSGGTFSFTGIIKGDLGADGFNIDNSYNIQVLIADKLTNNHSNPASFTLGPGTPAMAIYKNNVAIGQRYDTNDSSNKLQVNGNAKANTFNGNLNGTATNASKDSDGWLFNTYYFKNYRREMATTYTNLDNPGINGFLEIRNTELSYTGKKPFAGFYPFLNLKTPDNIAMLQIAGVNGNLYYRGKQSANVTMSGVAWAHIRDSANWGVSLYDNTSGTTGTVTLSETSANFSYLEIFYLDGSDNHSVRVYSPNGKKVSLFNFAPHSNTAMLLRYCAKSVKISGTSITNDGSYYDAGWFNADGASWWNANELKITKVLGYR